MRSVSSPGPGDRVIFVATSGSSASPPRKPQCEKSGMTFPCSSAEYRSVRSGPGAMRSLVVASPGGAKPHRISKISPGRSTNTCRIGQKSGTLEITCRVWNEASTVESVARFDDVVDVADAGEEVGLIEVT